MGHESHGLLMDAALGAFAGGVGTMVMGPVSELLYEKEGRWERWREDAARGGMSAYEVAAERVGAGLGAEWTAQQRREVGEGLHYALGSGAGAMYGMVRRKLPWSPPVKGLAFGAALWAVADEGAVPALGLTPGPAAFPWQTHARGLAAHLVLGLVTEGMLCGLDWLRKSRGKV